MSTVNNGPQIVRSGLVLDLDASLVSSYSAIAVYSVQCYSTYNGGLRSANYTVQYSDDNSTWTTAFTGVMSNNSSCGIIIGTNRNDSNYSKHRYWRYVEGGAVVGHHPRVSRIDFITKSGAIYNLTTYTTDNCADSGTYIVGTVTKDFGTTTWRDTSGNGYNGTLVNGVEYSGSNIGSLSFNGSNQRVSTNYKPSGERSYFIWVKFSSLTHSSGYSLTGTQEINSYTYIGIQNGGDVYYYAGASTGGNIGNPVTVNTWVNLGFALFPDGSRRVYKNGIEIHYNTGGLGGTATLEFSVGCINQTHFITGNIAQVSIYNRALSAAEVSQNYEATKTRFGL
jgi:hypothetical protein